VRDNRPVPLPADAHIGSIALTVTRLDRSLPFYLDMLGFAVRRAGDGRAELSAADDDRTLIELIERRDAVPRSRRTTGLYHFAILVPDRAALGRSLRRLIDRRWPMTGAGRSGWAWHRDLSRSAARILARQRR
jgi:catechol 2,3-dioxygenase